MIKSDFKFGERIKIKGRISRAKEGKKRFWLHFNLEKEEDAVFLTAYNLANGVVEAEYYDEGVDFWFEPKELIPGAWICCPNRKPEKVFLSDCIKCT